MSLFCFVDEARSQTQVLVHPMVPWPIPVDDTSTVPQTVEGGIVHALLMQHSHCTTYTQHDFHCGTQGHC